MTTILLIGLLACRSPAPEAGTLAAASTTVTFGSIEQLGSFVLEARIQRERGPEGSPPRTTVEAYRLRWKDHDHFEVVASRDGTASSHTLVLGGRAFFTTGKGPLRPQRDPEPYRVQLSQTWDPWTTALGPWLDHLRFIPRDRGVTAGRPSMAYDVVLDAPAPGKRTGWEPRSLAGQVWVDEATSVRLMADVRAEARSGRSLHAAELQMAVSEVGVDLAFTPPPPSIPPPPAPPPPGRGPS